MNLSALLPSNSAKPVVDHARFANPRLCPSTETPFLQALVRVGRSMFGDDWDDAHLRALDLPKEPSWDVSRALVAEYPVKRPPGPETMHAFPVSIASNSTGESADQFAARKQRAVDAVAKWEADKQAWEDGREDRNAAITEYVEKAREQREANVAHLERLHAAYRSLVQAIIDGLPAVMRCDGGDPVRVLMKHITATASTLLRTGSLWRNRASYHVTVNLAELERLFPLATGEPPAVDGVPMDALSPYLRLAITAALKEGVSPDKPSTVAQLTAGLCEMAPDFGLEVGRTADCTFSETFAESIAKALRWPNARLGKGMAGKHKTKAD